MRILLLTSALAFGAISAGGPATVAQAATCTTSWSSPVSGDWSVAANWTAGVPTSSSRVCITVTGTYAVTISQSGQSVASLTIGGSSGEAILDAKGSCDVSNTAALAVSGAAIVGRHGTIAVDAVACEQFAEFASPLMNHGLVVTEGTYRADIGGDVVNDRTIAVDVSGDASGSWQNNGDITVEGSAGLQFEGTLTNDGRISATGTGELSLLNANYTQGTGNIVGKHTVVMQGGALTYAGTGTGTVAIEAGATQIVGNVSAGQTLLVEATCTTHGATAFSDTQLTNLGTILVEPDSCHDIAQLETAQLVNEGTVRLVTSDGTNGPAGVEISGAIVNEKSFTVGAGVSALLFNPFTNAASGNLTFGVASASLYGNFADHAGTFTLDGTLTIATKKSYWPAAGLDFHLITGMTRTGTFATVNGAKRTGQTVRYAVLYDDPTASDSAGVSLTTS